MTVYETYELVNLAAAHMALISDASLRLLVQPEHHARGELFFVGLGAECLAGDIAIQDRPSRVPRTGETTHTDAA
jgi:hypothetical protein